MPAIEIDRFSLHYDELGDATNPPLVLVHGLYGEASGMAPIAERFAERFRVIAPDALGHGRSSHPAAVERSLADFDLRPGLPSITAPTLVLSGRSDGLNPPEAGEELARLVPGARFEVYEHAGHMLPYEETERLVAEVEAFLLG